MPISQRFFAIAMALSAAANSSSGKAEALGVVVQAEHAKLGTQAASGGTTIYDGDRLSTDSGGSLQVQIGEALLFLTDEASVVIHNDRSGNGKKFQAELLAGAVVLSANAATAATIDASSARIRPISETRGVVQVRRVGPYELIVYARRGAVQISYRSETETIAEGKSYRVLLNPDDDGSATGGGAKKPAKRNNALQLIAIDTAVAVGTVVLWKLTESGHKGVESPDRP